MSKTKPATIAEYIDAAPKAAHRNLREIYAILKKVAPGATEGVKWRTPVFEEKRILFAFAAFKSHVNFMPTPSAMRRSRRSRRSTRPVRVIQFPLDKRLPKAADARSRLARQGAPEKDARWM